MALAPVNLAELKAALPGSKIQLIGESIASSMTYPPATALSPQHGDALRLAIGRQYGLIGTGLGPARMPVGFAAAPGNAPLWYQSRFGPGNWTSNKVNADEHKYQWCYNSSEAASGWGGTAGTPNPNTGAPSAGYIFGWRDPGDDVNGGVYTPDGIEPLTNLFKLSSGDYTEMDTFDIYYSRDGSGTNDVDLEIYGWDGVSTTLSNFSLITTITVSPSTALTRVSVTTPTGFKRGVLISPDNRGATPDAQQGGWSVQFVEGNKARPAGQEQRVTMNIGASYGGQEIATAIGTNESAGDQVIMLQSKLTLGFSGWDIFVPIFFENDAEVTDVADLANRYATLRSHVQTASPGSKLLYLGPTIRNGASSGRQSWYANAAAELRQAAIDGDDYFIDMSAAWGPSNSFQPDAHLNSAGYRYLTEFFSQVLGFGRNTYWPWALTRR